LAITKDCAVHGSICDRFSLIGLRSAPVLGAPVQLISLSRGFARRFGDLGTKVRIARKLVRFWVAPSWFAGLFLHEVSVDRSIRRSRRVKRVGAYGARRLTRVQKPKRILKHLKGAGVAMLSDVLARCRYLDASQECASIGFASPETSAFHSQFGDDSQLTLYDWPKFFAAMTRVPTGKDVMNPIGASTLCLSLPVCPQDPANEQTC
jgi:hypothetical protein